MLLLASIIQLTWPGWLFQTIAIIFFGMGLFFLRYVNRKINLAHRTNGVLVDYYKKQGSSITYWPIIEFKNRAGDLVRGKSYSGFSIRYKKVGAELPIYYYPATDGTGYDVIINKFFWTYALPIYMIVFSIIAFLLPVFIDFPA